MLTPEQLQAAAGVNVDPLSLLLTQAGQRPVVYQRSSPFTMTAGLTPLPLQNQQFQCDAFVISVASALLTSVFIGQSSSVNATSGIEVQPGLPVTIRADNTREQWEIQRLLEMIAAMIANSGGYSFLPNYRAPRVVIDASSWYVVATAATVISVTLFNVPEQQ